MLAVSRGSILTLSTPFGTRGWWWDTMRAGSGEAWERYTLTAADNPRISPEFLAEEKRALGEFWYAQEYECRFLDSATAAFRQVDIDAAMSREIEQWDL
jgi:hypothetical protein